jgi:tetratricopeptide (TPR) repeat protein
MPFTEEVMTSPSLKLRHTVNAFLTVLFLISAATAQIGARGVRGQIFLPNGSPVQRQLRFMLTTDNGMRTEYLYTDSNGRIQMPAVNGPYTITVDSDSESYGTTVVSFQSVNAGNYITIHLKPLEPKASPPLGIININDIDRDVSSQAKESYESALVHLRAGEFEKAVEPLKRAIQLQPDYFHAHTDLGVLYIKLDKLDLAEQSLQRAIKINDKIYIPQLNLAIIYNKQSKYKQAVDVLMKVQRRNPDLAKVHYPLIEALMGLQDWAAAEEELKKALTVAELDKVDLNIKLGTVMMKRSNFTGAVAALQQATTEEPDNALAQFNFGAALFQTGNLDQAETALLKAYKSEGSKMAGAQLLLGQIYFQKKDYAKAIEAFELYLKDIPTAPNATQVKGAIEQLRQAIKKP